MQHFLRLLHWILDLILRQPLLFWSAMGANLIGVVWGGWIWYGPQLAAAPWWAWLFIPDCPAAALWATIAFLGLRYGRDWGWFNAFAAFACIKYGLWTLAFWLRHWSVVGTFEPLEIMLFVSHMGLTAEGVLLALHIGSLSLPVRLSIIGWFALSIWVDYGLGHHPPLTYAVPVAFVFWVATGLTALLGLALLLLPARLEVLEKKL
ncbi:DUF1405 domain-containing protein [Candidatus Chloroploca asiatica]|uniref:DUF1405 domain-containing protein n=1 Tax=Candidatus Chloroploca asiatica TaxID=1506545 RepID=A0A2H3KPW4_9CHLR|nr:DUF1405 domain-containing protein [Candidatus Chloroploca asiatica]PDW00344.1 hypothetical protein A9Q02_10115 [Candidatus Chloroploca asiatica]